MYAASVKIPNRFELCQATSQATRKLHIPSGSTEATINKVLAEISDRIAAPNL